MSIGPEAEAAAAAAYPGSSAAYTGSSGLNRQLGSIAAAAAT